MEVFPTIRSVNYMKSHKLAISEIIRVNVYEDQIIEYAKLDDDKDITLSKFLKSFDAVLIGYLDIKIKNIPLEFLKWDAAPLLVKSHQDFVDVINSFIVDQYKSPIGQSTIETVKRIHWFQHVGCTAQKQIDLKHYFEAI